ncbi:MAG: hypothetical protein Ct9H90mP16_20280 [Candidatus Poseidoniales archaeon]|nr:MAG: hypothetical protein Ct9H90mP16_20280 [Candidatus Poseidoniales archaeon]
MAAAFGAAMDGFGELEVEDTALTIDVASDDPMQAAFAGGLFGITASDARGSCKSAFDCTAAIRTCCRNPRHPLRPLL